jgi:hypothetical protein
MEMSLPGDTASTGYRTPSSVYNSLLQLELGLGIDSSVDGDELARGQRLHQVRTPSSVYNSLLQLELG